MGVFLPHLPAAGSCHGLHQFFTDPKLQQLVGDEDVAAGAGAVFADVDLLPVDADDAVGPDFAGDPAWAVSVAVCG